MIYPKPISYYQHANFEGERAEAVHPSPDRLRPIGFGPDPALIGRVISQLDHVTFRRFGTLRGEYVFVREWLALDRNGSAIRTNYDPDEDTSHNSIFSHIEQYCLTEEFRAVQNYVLENWDTIPGYSNLPVLSEAYAKKNYYHFMVRFIPQVRRYPDEDASWIGVPEEMFRSPYQRDLISRTYGDRRIVPLPHVFRVQDPQLSYEPISSEALTWLRSRVGLRARPGDRRIYIRRGASLVGRKGGDVAETPEFLAFLARHRFETISFGSGELSIAEQVALLDGAKVVMSPHGAGLTNIVYLDPGAGVIELFAPFWCNHSHMQLSAHLGLRHAAVVCEIDQNLNSVVDIAVLEAALQTALGAGD